MKKHLLVAAAAVGFAFVASGAHAQFVDPVCGFEHPNKAKELRSSLVQAYVSCGNPGGNTPNDTTESGVPSCSPPETYTTEAGAPLNGWHFDFRHGHGDASFKAARNHLAGPSNPPGDTADVAVTLRLAGIIDAAGPASGSGTLSTLSRATLRDRNGTPGNNGDDVPMTVIDFPAPFPFTLANGQAKLRTSANVVLNGIGTSLPFCTSIEVVDLSISDENGNRFASMGTFLPAR
jgi:hypothetical protein